MRTEYLSDEIVGRAVEIRKTDNDKPCLKHLQAVRSRLKQLCRDSLSEVVIEKIDSN